MKRLISVGVAFSLLAGAPLPLHSQSNQLVQGTQLRLLLLHSLSTSVAREGDPFSAVLAEPVYVGGQLILSAGAKVNGAVGSIVRPKRFALFRGPAAMNLQIQSIEVEGREVPAPMSILAIYGASAQANGGKRKDLRVEEGVVVESKRDVKGDVTTVGLGTAGGTAVGAVFSHLARGLVIGLIGGTAYIVVKKGKEVELPAQTGLLVRLDSNVTLPGVSAQTAPGASGQP